MKNFSILLAVLAALALPGVAMGQGSGADEYSEDIPGGGGNQPSNNNNGSTGSGGGGSALPSGTQADLAAQGDDGAAAANLAQSTGPGGNGGKSGGAGEAGTGSGTGSPSGEATITPADSGSGDSGGSGVGDVVADLAGGSDDGMGLLLPIILGSVLVAAVAFVLIRRSGGSTGSA